MACGIVHPHFLGDGMSSIWSDATVIKAGNKTLEYENIKAATVTGREHSVFYVPAQRVTTFDNGWPRRFQTYDASFAEAPRPATKRGSIAADGDMVRGPT